MFYTFGPPIWRCPARVSRSSACSLAITLFVAVHVFAQPATPPPLDARVVATVDRLYPGFTEILESRDSAALARLSRTLSANPSAESLSVLLWMLQYCPSWSTDEASAALQIGSVARAVGRLPVAPLSGALRNPDADQRITAAVVLGSGVGLIPSDEREALQSALIAGLSDPNIHVREFVAGPLRALRSTEGDAALARALTDPDVTDMFFGLATGRTRPFAGEPTAASFPPATLAAIESIAPDFLNTLTTRENSAVRQLLAAIERSKDPDTTPVLVWLLAYGDTRAYGGLILNRLTEPVRVARLPLGELVNLLAASDPDHRLAIAELFELILRTRGKQPASADRERMIAGLIGRLSDPNIDVRRRAAEALGSARASKAVGALASTLEGRDVTRSYALTVIRALASTGARDAIPPLERLARSASTHQVRENALHAYVALAKPADLASETRRLLWEQPDTALERSVLAGGITALPLAWQALASGTTTERRAAAALLGWFPDRGSIRPILAALTQSPGALTREQLLFDLNMILLARGAPPDGEQRNALAAAHLRWLYDQLANQPIDSDTRKAVLGQKSIAVFPNQVVAPFSVELSTQAAANGPQPGGQFSATAIRAGSPQAFLDAVAKEACGVAFHAITVAEGVARVATTLYLPRGRIANQVWISLYRNEGDQWVPLGVPRHPVLHRLPNEPNLLPTINRNYGADEPLKILRLDLTMERIRVDLKASQSLRNENLLQPDHLGDLDGSYVRLLDRYRRSDSLNVRYTAEFEAVKLTGRPDFQLWIDALAQQPGSPFQGMAQEVLAQYAVRQVDGEGKDLAGPERDQLVAAALNPEPVDRRLLPQPAPRTKNPSGATCGQVWSRGRHVRIGAQGRERILDAVRSPRRPMDLSVYREVLDFVGQLIRRQSRPPSSRHSACGISCPASRRTRIARSRSWFLTSR